VKDLCPVCRASTSAELDNSFICSAGHARIHWWACNINPLGKRLAITAAHMALSTIASALALLGLAWLGALTAPNGVDWAAIGLIWGWFVRLRWVDSKNGVPRSIWNNVTELEDLPDGI